MLKFTYRVYTPFDSYGQPLVLPEGRCVAYEARSFKWVDRTEQDGLCTMLGENQAEVISIFEDIQSQSELADCERRRMGCVVTDPQLNLKGRGYNGKPKGVDGKCQTIGCIPSLTCRLTLHAEQTALCEIPKTLNERHILFCTAVSCLDCQKMALARGVTAIVYEEERDQPEYDRPIMSAIALSGRMTYIQVSR